MKTIRVVAAVIRDGRRIFATQRGYGEFKDGWEFPGGKIEPGETPQEALRREIREELDAEITVGKLLCRVECDYPAFHLSMDCFMCTLRSGTLHLLEAEDGRWLASDRLHSVDWLPADLTVIEALEKELLSLKKVYFAGSIRGGRQLAGRYHRMIERIAQEAVVLTEHVGEPDLKETLSDGEIYSRDTAWIREADLVIAECTCPSLGVGYELAYAEAAGKSVHILYEEGTPLSAMLTGNPAFSVHAYRDEEDAMRVLEELLC